MIYFIIIMIRENDNNNKEYCSCEVTEQLQISEDINNMTDKKNGREYLGYVLEKLKERITEISLSLVEGQKEIEGMHGYYGENYTEMARMVMRIMIISRHCSARFPQMKSS